MNQNFSEEPPSTVRHLEGEKPRRSWVSLLIGDPLATAEAPEQAIRKVVGLAVFASDALSSTAYATQEMLAVLAAAGVAALSVSVPLSFAIVGLLIIVVASYEQTIHAYPNGGGAYIVAARQPGRYARSGRGRGAHDRLHPDRGRLDFVGRRADRLRRAGPVSTFASSWPSAWRCSSCWSTSAGSASPARSSPSLPTSS